MDLPETRLTGATIVTERPASALSGPAGWAAASVVTPVDEILYVAARAPRPGFAKTRLGRVIGDQAAATLYAAFLRDLAARFATAPFPVGWYVTPADAWDDLRPLVTRPGPTLPVLVQGPGDWTDRQRALFAEAAARGERRIVLIASDSPHLGTAVVAEAFSRLNHDDLVLGPVDDGGYYLIGMHHRAGRPRPWDALRGVQMSTGTVLDEIVARARSAGLAVGLVPGTFDVDEAADLERLAPLLATRPDLAATRAALEALGLIGPGGLPLEGPPAAVAASGVAP